jgi:hypothetical protein
MMLPFLCYFYLIFNARWDILAKRSLDGVSMVFAGISIESRLWIQYSDPASYSASLVHIPSTCESGETWHDAAIANELLPTMILFAGS